MSFKLDRHVRGAVEIEDMYDKVWRLIDGTDRLRLNDGTAQTIVETSTQSLQTFRHNPPSLQLHCIHHTKYAAFLRMRRRHDSRYR
jgi:hypothetical protein